MTIEVILLLAFHAMIFIGKARGVELTIDIPSSPEGSTVVITCKSESTDFNRIGRLESLTVERQDVETITTPPVFRWNSPKTTHTYTIEPVVKITSNNDITWGSAAQSFENRATASGNISSAIQLRIERTVCSDTVDFVCVAKGALGTTNSQVVTASIFAFPGSPRIKGGRTCTSAEYTKRDDCTFYTKEGELIELQCEARTGIPLDATEVLWVNDGLIIVEDNYSTVENSSRNECTAIAEGRIRFRMEDSDESIISCAIKYTRPNSTEVFRTSSQATICREGVHMKRFICEKSHIVGSFFGGVGAVLLLIIIFLLLLNCCGYRLTFTKKQKRHDLTRMK